MIGYGAMRIDVGTEFVATKEHVTAEKRVAFAFEIQILRQPHHFVAVLFHPARKVRRLASALLVPEIAGNEMSSDGEPGIRRENHVG